MKDTIDLPGPAAFGAARLGFWAALAAAVLTVVTFALAITAIPISGPGCPADCIIYPFSDVAAKVPHDYLWMYPAILLELAFVILFVSLHHCAAARRQVYSQIALSFAVMSALLLSADYYIQFAVLQPSIVRGEQEGLALLTQYNPHGVFIALEDLGYFLMSLAFLFAAPVFAQRTLLERVLRWSFVAAAVLTVGGWLTFYAAYGFALEYRFEIFAISVNWLTLLVAGILLSKWFAGQARRAVIQSGSPG